MILAALILFILVTAVFWREFPFLPEPLQPDITNEGDQATAAPAPKPERLKSESGRTDTERSKTEPTETPIAAESEIAKANAGAEIAAAIKPGFVRIACTPWAKIYLNGDSVGVTPLAKAIELPPGKHTLLCRNPQFPDYREEIQVQAGAVSRVTISLWQTVGKLSLNISPWAKVFIDGKYKDTVPPQESPILVAPGVHTLLLKHPALGEWQTEFRVTAGEDLKLGFNLHDLLGK